MTNKNVKTMEKEYLFRTLVRRDHSLGEKILVIGRIAGYKDVFCGDDSFAIASVTEGTVITTKCTPEQYEEFTKFTEKRYPDLCKFNWVKVNSK